MRDTSEPNVTHEEIEMRAYEIYLRRGGGDGRDLDDWVAAEQELAQERAQSAELHRQEQSPLGRRLGRSEAAGAR